MNRLLNDQTIHTVEVRDGWLVLPLGDRVLGKAFHAGQRVAVRLEVFDAPHGSLNVATWLGGQDP